MEPQYVARLSSSKWAFEASESHSAALGRCAYLFQQCLRKMALMSTQVGLTSSGTGLQDFLASPVRKKDRRLRCLRASNCWQFSALHSQRPRVHAKHRLKSLLWLIPRQSLLSRHIQVSTSNLLLEQAFSPAPTPLAAKLSKRLVHPTGGATWR